MTIQSAIENAQQKVANAYTAVSGKGGTLPSTQNLSNLPTAINSITELKGETKTVTPSTSQQTITPSSGKNGITQVTVNAVTSAIDSDIVASNIKSGVNILGVSGTVTELAGETRTVSLTSSSSSGQTFTPSSGKNGITSITVKANNQARTVTPSTSSQSLTVNSGYSGNGTITVNAVTSSIDSDIVAGNIKSGVNILGVTGTLSGANNTSLSITPTTSAQSYTTSSPYTGYSPVNVSAVTSAIDSNIQAGYIRNGVEILGVTGTYGEPLPSPQIFMTGSSSWYINSNNELFGCGSGSQGQQGSGDTSNVLTFTKRGDDVKQASFTENVSCYVDNNDILYVCGKGSAGVQGNGSTDNVLTFTQRGTNVKQVIACDGGTWYIDNNDVLYGCGSGSFGRQGNGSTDNVLTFTQRGTNVKQFTGGGYQTSWYVTLDGELYGCGYNNNGQQGSGDTTDVKTFTLRKTNIRMVAATNRSTWCIDNNDILYGCGAGVTSSDNTTTFTQVATNVKEVICGFSSAIYYITNDDVLYSIAYAGGINQSATNVKKFVCSDKTRWYIDNDDVLYGAGQNGYGQQGSGDTNSVSTYTQRGTGVKMVACANGNGNNGYSTGFTTQNDVYLTGNNMSGQQGSGTSGYVNNVKTFTKRN